MGELRDPASGPTRFWSAVLVGAACLVLWLGGAVRGFRPEPSGAVPADTPLPALIEPQGTLSAPPKVFRWTPGGPDVDLAQVAIFRGGISPLWQSAPLHGSSLEIDPNEVFQGIPAGEMLGWRVREVVRGRPRATSSFATFKFTTDTRGMGVGTPPEPRPLGK